MQSFLVIIVPHALSSSSPLHGVVVKVVDVVVVAVLVVFVDEVLVVVAGEVVAVVALVDVLLEVGVDV